ncbi:MAG: leucine-rich repeat protein, partial [Lachnospiraceae bacterium]|nr:leucine-rich repeat protein [Lachnospiraceae bacterium]
PVTVTLPILGYYNSSIPSQTSYIKEFEVTDTKDTIYFIARDGWKFDNIYLNSEFDAIADLTLDASKTVATIKITGNPTVNTWNYQVHYLATNPNIGGQMNDHLGISLTSKKPHIEFAAPDGMGNINYFNCISMAPGYTSDMWIVFNDGQGGETYTIPLDKLESNNKDVFTISSAGDSNNPDMFTLTTVGWGRGQLVYTDSNGKMYTVDVLSDIEHQNLGFYKEDKISKENWIPNEYVLKNKTKRFYFMAQNGWTFDNFVLDGDAKNFATLTLSEDKACVTITFTDKLKEYFTFDEKFMFGFEFTSKDAFGNSYTNHYGLNITNYLCEHPITYIKDKKEATNTTAGYTGDIVCEKCQDIVEVGKVIPVISDAISVNKGDVFTYGGYKYKALGNNAVAFCGVEGGNTKKITIPKTVTYAGENFKVTSIAKNAFKNNKKVTNITISENIMSIGNSAFSGCKNLKKIIIKSKKLKTVGKKAFKGIHKKAAIKVPKNKLKSYKKLLKGKGQASTVKIKK